MNVIEEQSKYVVVINGKGSSGKDTLIDYLIDHSRFDIMNISSIDPVKKLLKAINCNDVVKLKSDKDRKLMSDLKKAFDSYDDMSMNYLKDQLNIFLTSNDDILFVHIREPENIERFIQYIINNISVIPISVLVQSDRTENKIFNNSSDDDVDKYSYDIIFDNSAPIEISGKAFQLEINNIIHKKEN